MREKTLEFRGPVDKTVCHLVGTRHQTCLLPSHLPGALKQAFSREWEPEKDGAAGNSPVTTRGATVRGQRGEGGRKEKEMEEGGGGEGREARKRRAGREGREGALPQGVGRRFFVLFW